MKNSFPLFILYAATCFAQVTDLGSATKMQQAGVCPANRGTGLGSDYANYPFYDKCPTIISAWGSAVADTKRNRFLIWGGGHSDYSGNEVYALFLTGVTAGCSATGSVANGTAAPAICRLTDPSAWSGSNPSGQTNIDGTPVSRHTYANLAYLPNQDAMISFGGGLAPNGIGNNYTWLFSLASQTWTGADPTNGFQPTGVTNAVGSAATAYDPVSDSFFVANGNVAGFYKYTPGTNTYAKLVDNGFMAIACCMTAAIDPVRHRMYMVGSTGSASAIQWVDISGADASYTVHDITSVVTGCPSNVSWPGFDYDSSISRFALWPNSGNTLYIFDPATQACSPIVLRGATIASGSTNGTEGRLQYFPSLGYHVLVNSANNNAYELIITSGSSISSGVKTSGPIAIH